MRAAGVFRTVSKNVATHSARKAVEGLLASSSDINGSVLDDTVVQKNCSLHIRGNLLGDLTIESGAKVVVEGSVDGKIVNKGGRLVVNNKAHESCDNTVCLSCNFGSDDGCKYTDRKRGGCVLSVH